MKPSREEIESAIGGKLPEHVELEFGDVDPVSSVDVKFELVVFIKDKFKVFQKTWAGRIVSFYIVLHGLGFPISSPYDIVYFSVSETTHYSQFVYERAMNPEPEPPAGWLVTVPRESPMLPNGEPLSLDMLPIGSGIYPLSASEIQSLPRGLG